MSKVFSFWAKQHDDEKLELFNTSADGQLWLKTKSVVRRELLAEFTAKYSIKLREAKLSDQFEELYNIFVKIPHRANFMLDTYIREKNAMILKTLDREKLVSELYKLKSFEWGGDHQNSLDKYLISHYVKAISSYDVLITKFEHEINRVVQGYVLNSWYNHWSSILIEHIFKSHSSVLPTVGQIKSVDFFINNIPFDLKVTYFPSEYLKQMRKDKGLPVEVTYLKAKAKEINIAFDKNGSPIDIYYEITEKMRDKGGKACSDVLAEIRSSNLKIVKEAQENPKALAKWLYENQGEMRFGAENRLFLVLIDTNDFMSSWKLKRNLELLTPTINQFLDRFKVKKLSELEVEFKYTGRSQTFNSLADVIFVIK